MYMNWSENCLIASTDYGNYSLLYRLYNTVASQATILLPMWLSHLILLPAWLSPLILLPTRLQLLPKATRLSTIF